jgi:hypothetical protein
MLVTVCMRKKMLKVAENVKLDWVNKCQNAMGDIVHKSNMDEGSMCKTLL